MKNRMYGPLAAITICSLLSVGSAKCEVYTQLDGAGRAVSVHIVPTKAGRLWEPTGAAASSAFVLNPNGDLRGDGRPDLATNPVSGRPRVVWASRRGSSYDIVSSEFDGSAWSVPVQVNAPNAVDDLEPTIAFNRNGIAFITWWERGRIPHVRLAYAPPSSGWVDAGIVSATGEKAKAPAIRQEGGITIIAYRTPAGVRITTFEFRSGAPTFGDGPTPFPRGDPPPDTDGF